MNVNCKAESTISYLYRDYNTITKNRYDDSSNRTSDLCQKRFKMCTVSEFVHLKESLKVLVM